jgi:hypothetical protein
MTPFPGKNFKKIILGTFLLHKFKNVFYVSSELVRMDAQNYFLVELAQ